MKLLQQGTSDVLLVAGEMASDSFLDSASPCWRPPGLVDISRIHPSFGSLVALWERGGWGAEGYRSDKQLNVSLWSAKWGWACCLWSRSRGRTSVAQSKPCNVDPILQLGNLEVQRVARWMESPFWGPYLGRCSWVETSHKTVRMGSLLLGWA